MIKKKSLDGLNWYTKYYKAHYERKNKFRDDLLNPETLYQFLALKKCFVNSLNKISLKKKESRILSLSWVLLFCAVRVASLFEWKSFNKC